jgi:hypothetical protein
MDVMGISLLYQVLRIMQETRSRVSGFVVGDRLFLRKKRGLANREK